MMINDTRTWRHGLKVGDLVMMKHGGMAVITNIRCWDAEWFGEQSPPPPYIEMTYCDDGEHGSCSSSCIERMLSETR